MTDERERSFGPFQVREAPKSLVHPKAVVSVRLSETELLLVDQGGQTLGSWPRHEVSVDVTSDYYGCLRLGKDSVWVNTGEGRPLDAIRQAISGVFDSVEVSDAALAEDARAAYQNGPPVVIRVYPGRTQADAARLFQRDAGHAATYGYAPTGQSWGEGRPGLGRVVMLGFYSLMLKPQGYLTVTYAKAAVAAAAVPESDAGATKTCPMCAEEVKAAAKICRFCRYEFEAPVGDHTA